MRGTSYYARNNAKSRKTFGQAAYKWLKEWDGKDIERQKFALAQLMPYIGSMSLCDINNSALDGFKEHRLKTVMAGTINKELQLITTIMNVAAELWEWIDYVPKIRKIKGPMKVASPLTWGEQDALFKYLAPGWADGACLFAVNTGIRAGEMFGLKWEHIHPFNKGMVGVVLGKNGRERAVICNSLATLAVERQKGNGSDYIFASKCSMNPGGRITRWQKVYQYAADKAGLPNGPLDKGGIHNLRHTCGHRLRRVGASSEDRRRFLGHENANLMEHYAEADIERLMLLGERITERPKKQEFMLRSIRSTA